MFDYIKGVVTDQTSSTIVLENNNIGYIVTVANPYSFEIGETVQVYLYNKIAEDENSLYGFKSKTDRDLFLKLLNVKGLGPKVGIGFFAMGTNSGIIDAIERENVLYLKKFPKIGDKLARQIILDLKGKLVSNNTPTSTKDFTELIEVLKGFGYKPADINKILPNIKSEKVEDQVKEALKLMLK